MTRNFYRLLDHTADLGVEIVGRTPADLFLNAALALSELLWAPETVHAQRTRTVEAAGHDWADLMVNWMRELLYLWNGEQQLWGDVRIERIAATRLRARVEVEDYDADRHATHHDIKAVTYHAIEVAPTAEGWRGTVIFDV